MARAALLLYGAILLLGFTPAQAQDSSTMTLATSTTAASTVATTTSAATAAPTKVGDAYYASQGYGLACVAGGCQMVPGGGGAFPAACPHSQS